MPGEASKDVAVIWGRRLPPLPRKGDEFMATKTPRTPSIPNNLTTEVSDFSQLQERIVNLMQHYAINDQLCSSFGVRTPQAGVNGGTPIWYASFWLGTSRDVLADVGMPGVSLKEQEIVINQALEQATYQLAVIAEGMSRGTTTKVQQLRAAGQN
jgi:hypothetical protein